MTVGAPRYSTHTALAILAIASALHAVTGALAQQKAVGLVSYAATYRFAATVGISRDLKPVSPPRNIGHGTATIEFRRECDGWRYREELRATLRLRTPRPFNYVRTWFESADSKRFTYADRDESARGVNVATATAKMPAKGAGVATTVKKGKRHTMTLPVGTVFPATLIVRSLSAARSGDLPLYVSAFDGRYKKVPDSTTVKAGPADARLVELLPATLRAEKVWQFVGYTNRPDGAGLSDTVEYRTIAENGVILRRGIYFRALALKWALRSVRPLPAPDCPRNK